jgi:hypothetical protein
MLTMNMPEAPQEVNPSQVSSMIFELRGALLEIDAAVATSGRGKSLPFLAGWQMRQARCLLSQSAKQFDANCLEEAFKAAREGICHARGARQVLEQY